MYHFIMIKSAKELTRSQQKKRKKLVRGVYNDSTDDLFDVYLKRYPSGVVTLLNALSFYSMCDEWINPPFYFIFQNGYRRIDDKRIRQFREEKSLMFLGCIKEEHNGYQFNIFNKERLLIELWRKEKYIPKNIFKQAIFHYRELANSGELNVPLIREYLTSIPKSSIYEQRLSKEIL